MRKLSLFLVIVLMSVSSTIMAQAQKANRSVVTPKKIVLDDDYRRAPIKYGNNEQKQEILYTNTFDDPTQWIIESEGDQGEWQYFEDELAEMDFYGVNESATPEDGWAGFDGALYPFFVADGGTAPQNSTIELDFDIPIGVDQDEVFITINQQILTWVTDVQSIEVSSDDGFSWSQFIINDQYPVNQPFPPFQGEVTVDVSSAAANQTDIRVRFRWEAIPNENQASGYGWAIDDLLVTGPILNDVAIVDVFYNDNFETYFEIPDNPGFFGPASDETTDFDVARSLQYHSVPNYSLPEFNFAVIVENLGLDEQTGVQFQVTMEDPDGNIYNGPELLSDAITLPAGGQDTIRMYGVVPDFWTDPVDGTYFMDFQAIQNEEDVFPGNNFGPTRTTNVTSDVTEGGARIQTVNSSTFGWAAGNATNSYYGTRFAFTPQEAGDRVINTIEFSLQDETALNGIGQFIVVNMRKEGVLLDATEAINPAVNSVFPYDPLDPDAILYEITDETEFHETSVPVWTTVEIPPQLIEDGVVHQAEVRLLNYGTDAVHLGLGDRNNNGASVLFDPETPDDGWGIFGDIDVHIRFGTELLTAVDDVTYESGVKLVQNFPNPVVDVTTIQYSIDESSEVTFEVFDINGKLVHSEDLGNVPAKTVQYITFEKRDLASGTYTYSVVTGDERVTRKMIIE